MRCEDIQSVLIDFVDDHLDAIRRQEVVTHLEVCENCRQEESKLRELLHAVAETPEEQPGSTLRENFNRMMQSPPTAHGASETTHGAAQTTPDPSSKAPAFLRKTRSKSCPCTCRQSAGIPRPHG